MGSGSGTHDLSLGPADPIASGSPLVSPEAGRGGTGAPAEPADAHPPAATSPAEQPPAGSENAGGADPAAIAERAALVVRAVADARAGNAPR